MKTLQVTVSNVSGYPQTVHVFDTLSGGTRPVEGSPFDLRVGERTPSFAVNANTRGSGMLAYRTQSGLTRSGIEVTEGASVDLIWPYKGKP